MFYQITDQFTVINNHEAANDRGPTVAVRAGRCSQGDTDWIHTNTIVYSPTDEALTVSIPASLGSFVLRPQHLATIASPSAPFANDLGTLGQLHSSWSVLNQKTPAAPAGGTRQREREARSSDAR